MCTLDFHESPTQENSLYKYGSCETETHLEVPDPIPSTSTECNTPNIYSEVQITLRQPGEEENNPFISIPGTSRDCITPTEQAPITHSESLVMYSMICIPEAVNMDVKLEKTTFVLGETINVTVNLLNNSSLDISAVSVELYNKVIAKVSPPFHRFLTLCQLLTEDKGPEFRHYRTKKYSLQLKIPDSAEIPNFQNCTLLTRKEILQVTAIFKDSTKPKLTTEVELIIGHYSDEGVSKYTQDSVKICPLPYGIMSNPSIDASKMNFPDLPTRVPILYPPARSSPRSSTEQLKNRPKLVPPYPTEQFFDAEQVPASEAKRFSPHLPREKNLPYPPSDYCPYPKEDNPQFTAEKISVPEATKSPPYPLRGDCPYPKEGNLSSNVEKELIPEAKERNLPYPRSDVCPYPKHDNLPSSVEEVLNTGAKTLPYFSKEGNLPYPPDNYCTYPKEDKPSSSSYEKELIPEANEINLPYPRSDVCPYPKHDNLPSSVEEVLITDAKTLPYFSKEGNLPYPPDNYCTYPKEDKPSSSSYEKELIPEANEINLPYPRSDVCPYPKHDNLPSSVEVLIPDAKTLPYLSKEGNLPYPPDSYCPYPKEDKPSSSPYPSGSTCPYPTKKSQTSSTVGDPPYLKKEFNDDRLVDMSRSNEKTYPYRTEIKFQVSPLYSKKGTQGYNKIKVPSSSIRTSFEENSLPYPREIEEKTPLLHESISDASELPQKMPMPSMPSQSFGSFEGDGLPYPSKMQPPYPITDTSNVTEFSSPAFGNIAPYPPEKPAPHSTVGFAEFTPMPMPTDQSSIPCGSIGFAVPTSLSKNPLKEHAQPSAPQLSDIKSAPIARIEEIEDLLFIDSNEDDAEITDEERERVAQPKQSSSRSVAAPPSYEDACQSPKRKKKDRVKRQMALAS
ncbi:histone-lysine N-methyltransferase 2D-like [Anoplophora glabripennis]|uniref:histone-lysine N-methyltransferase 2D-like n=1 Tax=Anoplophora glabripennis TaxID=217634 RepID=UPI000C782065|nr:histone-lysine N-methyltransferase 2D-like [Anoplophora glabripennis]